jgi:hypothetical protein
VKFMQRRYDMEYGGQFIKHWMERVKETGNVSRKKGAGRPSVDADTVDRFRQAFQCSPGKSIGCADRELQIPRRTVQKFFHRRLKLHTYEGVSKSFRTDSLERELQMVKLSTTRCSCVVIL